MYKLGLSNKVIKKLEKVDDILYLRISDKIYSLENNPRPNSSIKLSGIEGYRIRIGDYRILYTINERTKEVVVYSFAHRKEVYKKHWYVFILEFILSVFESAYVKNEE